MELLIALFLLFLGFLAYAPEVVGKIFLFITWGGLALSILYALGEAVFRMVSSLLA